LFAGERSAQPGGGKATPMRGHGGSFGSKGDSTIEPPSGRFHDRS